MSSPSGAEVTAEGGEASDEGANTRLPAAHRAFGGIMLATAYVLSILPGVTIMSRGVWAPPGQEGLYGVLVAIISTLTILLATLYRREAGRLARGRVVSICAALVVMGLAALAGFAQLRGLTVFERTLHRLGQAAPQVDTVMVPVIMPARMARVSAQHGGRAVMVDEDPGMVRTMARDAAVHMVFTHVLFITLYLVMNICVVLALALAAWRVVISEKAMNTATG